MKRFLFVFPMILLTGCISSTNVSVMKSNAEGLPATKTENVYKVTYHQASTNANNTKTFRGHGLHVQFINDTTLRFGAYIPNKNGEVFECIDIKDFAKEDSLIIDTEYEKMTTTTTVKKK